MSLGDGNLIGDFLGKATLVMKSGSYNSAFLMYQKFNLNLVRLCLGLKLEFPYFQGTGKLA